MFDCAISSCARLVREHNLVLGSDAGEEAGEARSKQQRKKQQASITGHASEAVLYACYMLAVCLLNTCYMLAKCLLNV